MPQGDTEDVAGEETVQRHSDGRIARGERTREAIVEAHAELLREGVLKPTAKVIAERAGVSVRTLWLNFKDLETLLEATTAYWLDADAALRQADRRVTAAGRADRRCSAGNAPSGWSTSRRRPGRRCWASRSRRPWLRRAASSSSGSVATCSRPSRPSWRLTGGADGALCLALMAAASGMTWSFARDDLGRDVDDAAAIMRDTFTRLLGA